MNVRGGRTPPPPPPPPQADSRRPLGWIGVPSGAWNAKQKGLSNHESSEGNVADISQATRDRMGKHLATSAEYLCPGGRTLARWAVLDAKTDAIYPNGHLILNLQPSIDSLNISMPSSLCWEDLERAWGWARVAERRVTKYPTTATLEVVSWLGS